MMKETVKEKKLILVEIIMKVNSRMGKSGTGLDTIKTEISLRVG